LWVSAPSIVKLLGAIILLLPLVWQYYIGSQIERMRALSEFGGMYASSIREVIGNKKSGLDKPNLEKLQEIASDFEISLLELQADATIREDLLRRDVFVISAIGGIIAIFGSFWEIHRRTLKEIADEE
jgi:hypothetical protein